MSNIAVKLSGISKKYLVRHEKPTLIENILQRKTKEEFWALKDINLTIKNGEKLGIIGPNGSGKTTLLRIIAGITAPTMGTVETFGKVVSLIELAAGFQPDLTGEENIFLNGLLIGMTNEEISSKINKIIKFADIGHFIDAPFYTYSSGMALRLGFSIVVHANPDIMILDENLAVGDQEFRKKSNEVIKEMFKHKKTIILVSHWYGFIKTNCTSTIILKSGKIKEMGNSKLIINAYQNE